MRLFWRTMIAIAFILAVSSAAAAGPYDDASAAYLRKDYSTALRLIRPLAEGGNAESQYLLGSMYLWARGVPQDFSQAAKWLRRSASQGLPAAEADLGTMYDTGQGVPQDYGEALKWYRKAADQGFMMVQFNVGDVYAVPIRLTQTPEPLAKRLTNSV